MRFRLTVADIDIRFDSDEPLAVLVAHAKDLLEAACEVDRSAETDADEKHPLGFAGSHDLDPGRHDPPTAPWYDDEE